MNFDFEFRFADQQTLLPLFLQAVALPSVLVLSFRWFEKQFSFLALEAFGE